MNTSLHRGTASECQLDERQGGSVKSSDRTLTVLEYLAQAQSRRSLSEMTRDLGFPRSSLHGLLQTMLRRGWLATDASGIRFGVGARALVVGGAYLATDDLVTLSGPVLDALSGSLGETLHLGLLSGDQIMYVAKRDASHPLRLVSAVGGRVPAHATALGKVLLAERSNAEVREILTLPLPARTVHTIVKWRQFESELKLTRERGYAVDHEESTLGVQCFAVSVGPGQPAQYAISCSVPLSRLSDQRTEEILAHLQNSGAQIRELARSL
jgi:DNA-binding IclR family transcriptional regulator